MSRIKRHWIPCLDVEVGIVGEAPTQKISHSKKSLSSLHASPSRAQFTGTLLPASMEEEEANMTLPTYGNNGTVDYFAHVFSDRPSQVLAAAAWK